MTGTEAPSNSQSPAPPPTTPYGAPITLDQARKAAEAALAESTKSNLPMAIAVVDPAGGLVYFVKMDNTQHGSVKIAEAKARTSATFRRPTKVFQDALMAGNAFIMGLEGVTPVEGGLPIVSNGKIIGAIGASGGTHHQDGAAAKAGADAIK
jgi:glc operon protein GlcG